MAKVRDVYEWVGSKSKAKMGRLHGKGGEGAW